MANYIPPQIHNIPFAFNTGGYSVPNFNNLSFNFSTKTLNSTSSYFNAAISVMGTYQTSTYSFLKYCERYIIGYATSGVQIIQGKCYYGGIRDIGGYIYGLQIKDLSSFIKGCPVSDLIGFIEGHLPADLNSFVDGVTFVDLACYLRGDAIMSELTAFIAAHLPENLIANIYGWDARDLNGIITSLYSSNLPSEIFPIPYINLLAYLKVWPQIDITSSIYGWQTIDLSGYIDIIFSRDLSAYINAAIYPLNLRANIKGWAREVYNDLNSNIFVYGIRDFPADIRGTVLSNLTGSLFSVLPKYISASIRGWQTSDLFVDITSNMWPWDLKASIIGSGAYKNLPVEIIPRFSINNPHDLSAYILSTRGLSNFSASMGIFQKSDLFAFIDTGKDISNLMASLTPKMIRLAGIISIITMEHLDLSATISIPCFYSNFKDLSGHIVSVYMKDLQGIINGIGWIKGVSELSARWGYSDKYVVQDKFSINLSITTKTRYIVEDKLYLYLQIFRQSMGLGASVTGIYRNIDLSAYVYGLAVKPHDFGSYKNKERVYFRNYTQEVIDFEIVDMEFEDIVRDYMYNDISYLVTKTDRYEHLLTKISSYYSKSTSERLNKKLHKTKILYDLRKFDSIDSAVKYAINYVTSYSYSDFSVYLNVVGQYIGLNASLNTLRLLSSYNNMTSDINGTVPGGYSIVVGKRDGTTEYFPF